MPQRPPVVEKPQVSGVEGGPLEVGWLCSGLSEGGQQQWPTTGSDREGAAGCRALTDWSNCGSVSWHQGLDALRQQVRACPHCRPDMGLGYPD
ncbi:DUF6233 domain-containing protein [Streptomyces sp. NPDC050388]|uniref:DUF6233 domain-containing protein n=1 Tax=Streptomyces sp. NPDC050388 TaxID=3155781 RepID=UPI00344420D4